MLSRLVLLSALLVFRVGQTKDIQECEQISHQNYECRDIENFEQLSQYIQEDWQSVNVVNEHTGIENDDKPLPTLSKLLQLDLSQSGGLTLGRYGFRNFASLQRLNLTHCQLEELRSKHFADNASLVNLDVSHNDLLLIERALMRQLPNLVYANFSNNLIANVEFDAFKGLKYLEFLDLNTNEQENITLGSNDNLRYLSISNNNVRDVG